MPDSIPCPKCGRLYVWNGTRCCRKDCRYGSNKKPPKLRAKVVGVYPVEAAEPVHLVEISIEGGAVDAFDLGEITQEIADTPRMNWQAPYGDQVITETDGKARVVFFFHYLDLNKPLMTPAGALALSGAKEYAAAIERYRVRAAVNRGARRTNHPLHLTAAAIWFFKVQRLTGRRGR